MIDNKGMAVSAVIFRDWIPEGEEVNAQGKGFKDFVPVPEPKKVLPEEMKKLEEEVKTTELTAEEIIGVKKRGKNG